MRGMYIATSRIPPRAVPPSAPVLSRNVLSFNSIQIVLLSTPAPGQNIVQYNFERAPALVGPYTIVGSNSTGVLTDLGLTPATTYFYRGRATQTDNQVSSYCSAGEATTFAIVDSSILIRSAVEEGPSSARIVIEAFPPNTRTVTRYFLQRSLDGVAWDNVDVTDQVAASEIPAEITSTPNKWVHPSGTYLGNPAFTTIQAAFDTLDPGDHLAIAYAVYAERGVLTRSGTAANPIIVRCADYNNRPVFDGQDSTSVVPGWNAPFTAGRTQLLSVMANHVTVDGLNFIRSPQGGILVGDAANNGNFTFAINTFYTGNKIIRCSVIGSETAFRTINVDGLDVLGCTFRDCQRSFYRADGFPEDNPTWGSAVSLMGKRINFIENTVAQSSGEGVHLGIHIKFGDDNTFIQCENVVLRNNRIFDCWSAPLYISNVDVGVVERNVIYHSGDTRYWQYASSGYPKYCIDIASESGDPGVGGWPPPNGFIGARDLIIRNNIATGALHGMRFTNWPSQNTTRVKVLHNTFFRSVGGTFPDGASLIENEEPSLSDITFWGNIVYDAVSAQMCRTWLQPGGAWSHGDNIFSTNPPAALIGTGDIITTNPGLANKDYAPALTPYPAVTVLDTTQSKLVQGSVAVNSASALPEVLTDFYGNVRPRHTGNLDRGAISLSKPSIIEFVDTAMPSGGAFYRAAFQNDAGVISGYSPASFTGGAAAPSPTLLSRFAGLTGPTIVQDYGNGVEFAFTGTDSITGQVWSPTSPQLWGSQSGNPQIQALTNLSHTEPGINNFTNWSLSLVPGVGLRIVRNSPYLQADQAAFRIKPSAPFASQSMVYIRGKIKLDATWPSGPDQFIALAEVKIAGTNQKVECTLNKEFGVWWMKLTAARADGGGANSIWGTGFSPSVTCTPAQDSFFQTAGQDTFFRSFTPTFGSWMTYEFAFRLQDGLGQVQGNGASGWCYAAIATGSPSDPPANGSATSRLYVPGRNMHGNFGVGANGGATLVFPFNCYTDANMTGKTFEVGEIEVRTSWPADASSRPAEAI